MTRKSNEITTKTSKYKVSFQRSDYVTVMFMRDSGGSSDRRSGEGHSLVKFFSHFFLGGNKKKEFYCYEYAFVMGF
jgi:hypothetical protein